MSTATPAPVTARDTLRALIIGSLSDLAAAREYAAAYPEPVKPARNDHCPDCGACPGIIPGTRQYRAWVPSGGRCGSAWHEAAL